MSTFEARPGLGTNVNELTDVPKNLGRLILHEVETDASEPRNKREIKEQSYIALTARSGTLNVHEAQLQFDWSDTMQDVVNGSNNNGNQA